MQGATDRNTNRNCRGRCHSAAGIANKADGAFQAGGQSGIQSYFVDFTNSSIGPIKTLVSEMNTTGFSSGSSLRLAHGGMSRQGKTISQALIDTPNGAMWKTILIRRTGTQ